MGSSSSKCEECADCGDLQEELERTQEELAAAKNQQVITPIYKVPQNPNKPIMYGMKDGKFGPLNGGSRRTRRPRRSRRKSHKKRNSK
jgi:hypothetical protein